MAPSLDKVHFMQHLNKPKFVPEEFNILGKDAKTAVEQAVAVNDQAVMVDLLSVIVLRPSIWNLDLCTTLLPPIGDLLQSKYES